MTRPSKPRARNPSAQRAPARPAPTMTTVRGIRGNLLPGVGVDDTDRTHRARERRLDACFLSGLDGQGLDEAVLGESKDAGHELHTGAETTAESSVNFDAIHGWKPPLSEPGETSRRGLARPGSYLALISRAYARRFSRSSTRGNFPTRVRQVFGKGAYGLVRVDVPRPASDASSTAGCDDCRDPFLA